MRRVAESPWCVTGLASVAILCAASLLSAGPLPRGMRVHGELGFGYDTNALQFHFAPRRGAFVPYHIDTSYEVRPNPALAARFETNLGGAAYFEPVAAARQLDYALGLRLQHRVVGGRLRSATSPAVDLELRPYVRGSRSVYISKVKRHELILRERAHDDVLERRVSLGHRYDAQDIGAEASLALHWPRRTEWEVEYEVYRRNYINDYRNVGTADAQGNLLVAVSRYDYDDWAVRAGIRQSLPRGLAVRSRYWHEQTNYAAWPARDFDGNPLREASVFRLQRYNYDVVHGEIRWASGQVDLALGGGWAQRRDPTNVPGTDYGSRPFAYLDRTTWSVHPEIRVRPAPRVEVTAEYDYAHLDYPHAREHYNALRPTLDRFPRTLMLQGTYRMSRNARAYARYVFDNVDGNSVLDTDLNKDGVNDATLAYERVRVSVGYEFRY